MGHVITKDALKPDPDKIKEVENMPKLMSKQELMCLLGFVNYLAKFLPKLSATTRLTTKKAQFCGQHNKTKHSVK